VPPQHLPWIRIRSEQYACIAKGSVSATRLTQQSLKANVPLVFMTVCILQQKNGKVVDSVEAQAHHSICACLSCMDNTKYSLYRREITGTPTSSVAFEVMNVVCRLKLRDEGLG